MRCFTCVLDISTRFGYQHVGIKNATENTRKMREDFSILHNVLGKNTSQLRFFTCFGTFEIAKTQTQRTV